MDQAARVREAPNQPTLVYDGDCGFCRRCVARMRSWTGDRVDYVSFQEVVAQGRFPEIPRERFEESVQFVDPAGEVRHGADAVARALATVTPWPLRIYRWAPGARAASEMGYRWVARRRETLSRWINAMWGPPPSRLD